MEWFLYDSDLHHERAKGLTQDTTNFLGDIDGLEDYHLTEKKKWLSILKNLEKRQYWPATITFGVKTLMEVWTVLTERGN